MGAAYPNPFNGNVNFSVTSTKESSILISILSLDGKLYLGHDIPEAIITKEELREIRNKVWIHCKNLKAFSFFSQIQEEFYYFLLLFQLLGEIS